MPPAAVAIDPRLLRELELEYEELRKDPQGAYQYLLSEQLISRGLTDSI